MPSLYIGNATRQRYDFQYRTSVGGAVRSQLIPVGSQLKISGELTLGEIDYILGQHSKYGLIAEDRIDRTKDFAGTCYAVGKPITNVRLMYLMESNLQVLVKRGEEIRKANAVGHSNIINEVMRESQQAELPVLELTVQQERRDPDNNVPQLAEGILVSSDPDAQPLSGRGKRRAA
jgi:hypothetical protein